MIQKHQLTRAVTKSNKLAEERRKRGYELHQMPDDHQAEHARTETILRNWAGQTGTCLSLATIA